MGNLDASYSQELVLVADLVFYKVDMAHRQRWISVQDIGSLRWRLIHP